MTDDRSNHRLQSVVLDETSLASASRDQEHERQVAIFDLLEANFFRPEGAAGGPYDLKIALIENRLALDIQGPSFQQRHLLSLSPFRGVIRAISWSARAITTPSATPRRRRSRPWTWAGAACTTKARPCCGRAW